MAQLSAAARSTAGGSSTRPCAPADPADQPPDVDLLARLTAGDPHALRLLHERYTRLAHTLARRICRDQGLAEDVVQEAFLTLWREHWRYTPTRGTFPAWLLTVVHHKAVDAIRREHPPHRQTTPHHADDDLAPGPGADEAALKSMFTDQLHTALHQLPPNQRHPLLLAYYGGYTHREISNLVKIPLGTVKSRIFHGIQRLRTLLHPLQDPA